MKSFLVIVNVFLILFTLGLNKVYSQISIEKYTALTDAQAAYALVDSLVDDGIIFSDITFRGVRNSSYGYQMCYFTTTGLTETQMGISRGIALTTGNTDLISLPMGTNPGASNSFSKGYISSHPGEIRKSTVSINDMDVLAGSVNWYNGAILEFDFIPIGDSVVFNYVFGGEEYSDNTNFTNYQCTQYNDKFGFLISGPGISGGAGYTNDARNIARLNNGWEVGINSVNNGTVGSSGSPNGASFCSSTNPDWVQGTPSPEYNGTIQGTSPNGNTKVLTASQGGLTPGQTYHIKLLICDAKDGAYDAIVYIEAGSFKSPTPDLSLNAHNSSICETESTWVVASLTNGTPPFTYEWSNGTTNNSSNMADSIQVSPASNTTYSVTVTDATAQTFTASQLITVTSLVTPTFTALSPYCVGDSPAVLSGTSTNGITGIWLPATIITASAGTTTYSFTANAGQCASNTSMDITVNDLPTPGITNNSGTTVLTCAQISINVTTTGGISYAWSGGNTPTTASNALTSSGTYTVTVTNASACTATSSIIITENTTPPTAAITNNSGTTAITCTQTSISVTATGGGTYTWSGGATTNTAANTFNTAGTYTVTVTAANGCTDTETITITENTTPPTAAITNNSGTTAITCTQTSISVTATGGGTYTWSGGATTNTAANTFNTAGTYTVTVTAANGCAATETITITQDVDLPVVTITNNTGTNELDCNISTISVIAEGGDSYLWNGGLTPSSQNNSFIAAGSYIVTVFDSNGCTSSGAIIITENTDTPNISILNNTGIYELDCNITEISVTANGGISYLWNSGTSINTPQNSFTIPGIYTVTVTGSNGCTSSQDISLTQNTNPPVVLITNTTGTNELNCTTTVIELLASGAGTYAWSGGSAPASALNLFNLPGTYTVTVTGTNGCTAMETYTITQNITIPSATIINNTGTLQLDCNNASINLTAAGGVSFIWSSGSTVNSATNVISSPGTYTVTVTALNGCIDTENITISYVSPPNVILTPTSAICGGTGGSVIAAISGGSTPYNIVWSNNQTNTNLNNLSPGDYIITVTDDDNCTATATTTIAVSGNINASISQIHAIGCSGENTGSLLAESTNAVAPTQYNWSNGSTNQAISDLYAGIYSVTIMDSWSCTAAANTELVSPASMQIDANISGISCNGEADGSIQIFVTNGNSPYFYYWNNMGNTASLSGLEAGTYSVTVTDNMNCSKIESYIIDEPEILFLEENHEPVKCYGTATGSINLSAIGGTAPYSFILNWGIQYSNKTMYENLYAGTYSVVLTDSNGCEIIDEIIIDEPAELAASIITTNPSCRGGSDGSIEFFTSGGTEPYLFSWDSNVIDISFISGLGQGIYDISIIDANECVNQIQAISLTDTEIDCIKIPDAFTPNSDGINDQWMIDGIELFPDSHISVFNRWGQLLYQMRGDGEFWDGTYNGKFVPTGSYVYIIKLNKNNLSYSGIVSVIY